MADYNLSVTASALNTAITQAANAAPQSTTYTKTEVNTALAAKQDSLTQTQLAAVNSGITADKVTGLEEVVNAGAKNILKIVNYAPGQTFDNGGRTFTFLNDGGVKITGAATGTGNVDCYLVGSWTEPAVKLPLNSKDHVMVLESETSLSTVQLCVVNRSTGSTVDSVRVGTNKAEGEVIDFDATAVFLSVGENVVPPEDGIIVYPMICLKGLFDISSDFEQYAPTNRELYEMILAMQA